MCELIKIVVFHERNNFYINLYYANFLMNEI